MVVVAVLLNPVGATLFAFSFDRASDRRLALAVGGIVLMVVGLLMVIAGTRGG